MKIIVENLKIYPFESFSDADLFRQKYHPDAEVVILKGYEDLYILKSSQNDRFTKYFDTNGRIISKLSLH